VLPVAIKLLSGEEVKKESPPPEHPPIENPNGGRVPKHHHTLAGTSFFRQKVAPILANNCFKCHGPDKQKAGLRLDSREAIVKGSEYGTVFDPKNPEKSILIDVVSYDHETKMPPKVKLPQEEIEILKKWVVMGMPWDRS